MLKTKPTFSYTTHPYTASIYLVLLKSQEKVPLHTQLPMLKT